MAHRDSQFDHITLPKPGRLLLISAPRKSGRSATIAKLYASLYKRDKQAETEVVLLPTECENFFDLINEIYSMSYDDPPEIIDEPEVLENMKVLLVDDLCRQPAWMIRKLAKCLAKGAAVVCMHTPPPSASGAADSLNLLKKLMPADKFDHLEIQGMMGTDLLKITLPDNTVFRNFTPEPLRGWYKTRGFDRDARDSLMLSGSDNSSETNGSWALDSD